MASRPPFFKLGGENEKKSQVLHQELNLLLEAEDDAAPKQRQNRAVAALKAALISEFSEP